MQETKQKNSVSLAAREHQAIMCMLHAASLRHGSLVGRCEPGSPQKRTNHALELSNETFVILQHELSENCNIQKKIGENIATFGRNEKETLQHLRETREIRKKRGNLSVKHLQDKTKVETSTLSYCNQAVKHQWITR